MSRKTASSVEMFPRAPSVVPGVVPGTTDASWCEWNIRQGGAGGAVLGCIWVVYPKNGDRKGQRCETIGTLWESLNFEDTSIKYYSCIPS